MSGEARPSFAPGAAGDKKETKGMIELTETEQILLAQVLELAHEQFSNHGCNDFDLIPLIPDKSERIAFLRKMDEWNGEDPDDTDRENYNRWTQDSSVMHYFADKFAPKAEEGTGKG